MKKTPYSFQRIAKISAPFILAAATLQATAAHADWKASFDSKQTIYQNGTPHTDKNGAPMMKYDAARSFFPLSIYHALETEVDGVKYTVRDLKKANFNTFFSWWGNDRLKTIKVAEEIGMQAVFWAPEAKDIEIIKQLAKSPAMLGYNLDDEPIGSLGNGIEERFAKLEEAKKLIRSVDSKHVLTQTDAAWIIPPATAWWTKLNTWGDVSTHDNYPINGLNLSLSHQQGIPESMSLATAINKEQKPVWFVAQNHEFLNATYNNNFPTAAQQRCMVYTAIIHGATGVCHFALDSFVTRDGKVVGISPDPKPKYHIGYVANETQLRQSKELWHATAALNEQITTLRPALLSPTAKVDYSVEVDDSWKPVTKTPIRTILKENPAGGYVLLVANIDAVPQHVRIRFADKKFKTTELFNPPGAFFLETKEDAMEFMSGAWDVRIFQIDLQ